MVSATCRYSLACRPLLYSKCPSRRPPVLRSSSTTSSWVGTRCISVVVLVSAFAAQNLGYGAKNNFPIERERPRIDVLHVQFHPGLKVHRVAPADRPQAS